MLKPNPELLILAREIRGITQTQLSKALPNLSQGNLSRMERGDLSIPSATLQGVADHLNFPINFFYQENVKTPISEFYYRKRKSLPKKHLSILESRLDLVRICIDILLESVDIPEFDLPPIDLEIAGTPEEAARKARSFLNIPKGPVNNLVGNLEDHGVIVYFISTNTDKFDGITLMTDKNQPIIFVNQDRPNDRKRFTIAHELGHLLLHLMFPFLPTERIAEQEADRFAAEFLLPELDCINELYGLKYRDLPMLKQYWKTSMKAIIKRASDLKTIPSNRAKNLYIELSKQGFVKQEPYPIEIDTPEIITMILEAIKSGLDYTDADIAEMLRISIQDYYEFFGRRNRRFKVAYKRTN